MTCQMEKKKEWITGGYHCACCGCPWWDVES
jgi:hypothetical protein